MLRPPGNATLATHRSVVVTYDLGSSEHAVVAHPAAVTAAHTPKKRTQGGYRPLLVGRPAGQLGGSKRAHGWWRRRTPIKMGVANGLGGARPPDRSRPLPTRRRGGDRLRMSVDGAANVHGGPVSVGRGTRWVGHRYWSKISLAFACAFARIWDAEAKTAAATKKNRPISAIRPTA